MSLILEALRKSEAERRLGSAPGVLAAMPVLRASVPRSRRPLVLAGTSILLTVLALAWWWMHQTQITIVRSTATRTAANTKANNNLAMHIANNTVSDAVRAPQNLPTITLPVSNVAQPIAAAAPAATKTVAPVLPQAPTAASMPGRTAANAITSTHPTIDSATPHTPIIAQPDIKAAAAAPSSAKAAPVEPVLISVNDLPADERGNLPALKVSMHVYADDPAQRFMIVNGQRVGEGAPIADGVVIVRIRRDGAEIDLHGRRLLLPKP